MNIFANNGGEDYGPMEPISKVTEPRWVDGGRYHFHEDTKPFIGFEWGDTDRWWSYKDYYTAYMSGYGGYSYSYETYGIDYAGYDMQDHLWEDANSQQNKFRQQLLNLSSMADYETYKMVSDHWDLKRLQDTIDRLDGLYKALTPYIGGDEGGSLNKLWKEIDTPDGPMTGSAASAYQYRLKDLAYRLTQIHDKIPDFKKELEKIRPDLKTNTYKLSQSANNAINTYGGTIKDVLDKWYFNTAAGTERFVEARDQFDIRIVAAGTGDDGTPQGEVRGIVGDDITDSNVNNTLYKMFRDHYKTVYDAANTLYTQMVNDYSDIHTALQSIRPPRPLPTETPGSVGSNGPNNNPFGDFEFDNPFENFEFDNPFENFEFPPPPPPPPPHLGYNGPGTGDGLGDGGPDLNEVLTPPPPPPDLGLNGPTGNGSPEVVDGPAPGMNGPLTPPPAPPNLGLNGPGFDQGANNGPAPGMNGPLTPPPAPPNLGLNGPGFDQGANNGPAPGMNGPLMPPPPPPNLGLNGPGSGRGGPGGYNGSLERDPATGLPINPETGQPFPIDPETGLPFNPVTELPINYDPSTGQALPIDPVTGEPVGIDPQTGLPTDYGYGARPTPDLGLNGPGTSDDYGYGLQPPLPPPDLGLNGPGFGPDTEVPINPVTGEPYVIDPITGQPYPIDPETGAPVTGGFDIPDGPIPDTLPPLQSPDDVGLNYGGLSPGPYSGDGLGDAPGSSDRSSLFTTPDGAQYPAGGASGAPGGQGAAGGGVGGVGALGGQPGAGSGASGMGGMPMMPPMMGGGMGSGAGDNNRDRQRSTWLSEDEKVWGTAADGQRSALGRPVPGQNKKGTPRHEFADATPDGRGTGTASQDDGPAGGRKRKPGVGNRRGHGQEQAGGREGGRDGGTG
ncbi:hypothetical protein A6A08_24720 [Nocardiopsis sp. TSRI0078]|nr:hypothetical protein A6A08_24720 [Nocardiopsis sp. TSRI0078]